MPGIFVPASAEPNLFGLCRAQPKISKKWHYATGHAPILLIEFVKIRATEQVAIFEAHCIRVNFFDIFGCARHNPNKFGSALACTKIREIRGQKIRGIFLCKVIPPPPHFQQKHPKTTPVFFSLKVVPESAESRFFLLDFHRPAPAVRTPRAQDAVAPRA